MYNDKMQMSTGFSPFYLNYGQHSQKSTEPQREVETEAADVFSKQIKKVREEAVAALEKAVSDMKRYYDEVLRPEPHELYVVQSQHPNPS